MHDSRQTISRVRPLQICTWADVREWKAMARALVIQRRVPNGGHIRK